MLGSADRILVFGNCIHCPGCIFAIELGVGVGVGVGVGGVVGMRVDLDVEVGVGDGRPLTGAGAVTGAMRI